MKIQTLMMTLRRRRTWKIHDGESEEDERLPYNGVNGATQDYNDQGSDAEDEDDDDDDDEEEDTETAPVVRGKKRKYDNEDLLQ